MDIAAGSPDLCAGDLDVQMVSESLELTKDLFVQDLATLFLERFSLVGREPGELSDVLLDVDVLTG